MNGIPDEKTLVENLDKIAYTIDKAYIDRIKEDYAVCDFNKYRELCGGISYDENIRIIRVTRWVKDTEENVADCFKNILGLFSSVVESNFALILSRKPDGTQMYFVVRNTGSDKVSISGENRSVLEESVRGNFNGSMFEEIWPENALHEIFGVENTEEFGDNDNDKPISIATVCGIPSEKSENYISQGIEKLFDGIVPSDSRERYTVVILGEPLSADIVRNAINGYEEIATALTPFADSQFQSGTSSGENKGTMDSLSDTKSVGTSITKTHSGNVNVNAGLKIGNASIGGSAGYGYSRSKGTFEADAQTKTVGTNYMLSFGKSEGTTYSHKAYPVSDMLEKIEKTIKRVQNGQSTGLWKYAAYVLSPSSAISKKVAGFIVALSQGDQSYIEQPIVREWSIQNLRGGDKARRESADFKEICKYVSHFTHPQFYNRVDKTEVTATTNITTTELSNLFAFPRFSVQGLPILECVRFGREPNRLIPLSEEDVDIRLGCAYHMHQEETKKCISLSRETLKAHTFITGSTLSGKSNTVYTILKNVKVPFLVVEPAKGEYKNVFGDAFVWGTNQYTAPLLHLNPFSFVYNHEDQSRSVHVLEHIDRIVEVFNACWPMYAAMPAILKEAVESAYERVGWNLAKSVSATGEFPTFETVLEELPKIIERSEYSKDTASDYKGALITRVRSLTKGLYRHIFNGYDIDMQSIFEKNTIIDLSRVQSSETKALIMGIIVTKLHEYRVTHSHPDGNELLKHLTVLEEAHNLLRRTSAEQTQESSNVQGKSVEMLANAIAEMRTYGEGFIIVDQSPGLLDMAVIRNTNTKIMLYLPDEGDRKLVGRAAGLSEAQITELSRLAQGIAAVSQKGWLEPVLCKVDLFNKADKVRFEHKYALEKDNGIEEFLNIAFGLKKLESLSGESIDAINNWRAALNLDKSTYKLTKKVLGGEMLSESEMQKLAYDLFGGSHLNYLLIKEKASDVISAIDNSFAARYQIEAANPLVEQVRLLITEHLHAHGELRYFANLLPFEIRNGEQVR